MKNNVEKKVCEDLNKSVRLSVWENVEKPVWDSAQEPVRGTVYRSMVGNSVNIYLNHKNIV